MVPFHGKVIKWNDENIHGKFEWRKNFLFDIFRYKWNSTPDINRISTRLVGHFSILICKKNHKYSNNLEQHLNTLILIYIFPWKTFMKCHFFVPFDKFGMQSILFVPTVESISQILQRRWILGIFWKQNHVRVA